MDFQDAAVQAHIFSLLNERSLTFQEFGCLYDIPKLLPKQSGIMTHISASQSVNCQTALCMHSSSGDFLSAPHTLTFLASVLVAWQLPPTYIMRSGLKCDGCICLFLPTAEDPYLHAASILSKHSVNYENFLSSQPQVLGKRKREDDSKDVQLQDEFLLQFNSITSLSSLVMYEWCSEHFSFDSSAFPVDQPYLHVTMLASHAATKSWGKLAMMEAIHMADTLDVPIVIEALDHLKDAYYAKSFGFIAMTPELSACFMSKVEEGCTMMYRCAHADVPCRESLQKFSVTHHSFKDISIPPGLLPHVSRERHKKMRQLTTLDMNKNVAKLEKEYIKILAK